MTPFNLRRFEEAQGFDSAYDRALKEICAGRKQSHWMWFVFPQIVGLGHSMTAQKFAIVSLDEARAYLAHPTLGSRLEGSTQAVIDLNGSAAGPVFGRTDAKKLKSSLTLFAEAATRKPVFEQALGQYFGGQQDEATIRVLEDQSR